MLRNLNEMFCTALRAGLSRMLCFIMYIYIYTGLKFINIFLDGNFVKSETGIYYYILLITNNFEFKDFPKRVKYVHYGRR